MAELDQLAERSDRLRARHDALNAHASDTVLLVGDPQYLLTYSGQLTWLTLVNLLARLYKSVRHVVVSVDPTIALRSDVFTPVPRETLFEATVALVEALAAEHISVSRGELVESDAVIVRVGGSHNASDGSLTVAGCGWLAFLNEDSWRREQPSDRNPIGAMVAACVGTAAVYRRMHVRNAVTEPLVLSAFDYSTLSRANPELPATFRLQKSYLAGAGAVGMAAIFTLLNLAPNYLSNGVLVIDDDRLDTTNLNRCLLAVLADITHGKIEIVERHAKLRGVGVSGVHSTWQKFVAPLEEGVLENVLSAVDVYESRMSVQYDRMPRSLFTAGTADFLLSVSRHELDDGMSCGACYQARGKVQTCGHQSEQTQRQFEQSPDPSIGFVSVMAGVALVAELMKASDEQLRGAAVRNTVRLGMNVLSPTIRAKVFARSKDPRCNCGSEYVRLGYRKIWKP